MKGLAVVAALIFFTSAIAITTNGKFELGGLALVCGPLSLIQSQFAAELAFLLYLVFAVKTFLEPDKHVLIMATSYVYMM